MNLAQAGIGFVCLVGLVVAHILRVKPKPNGAYQNKHIYPGAPKNLKWLGLILLYYVTSPIWGTIVICAAG